MNVSIKEYILEDLDNLDSHQLGMVYKYIRRGLIANTEFKTICQENESLIEQLAQAEARVREQEYTILNYQDTLLEAQHELGAIDGEHIQDTVERVMAELRKFREAACLACHYGSVHHTCGKEPQAIQSQPIPSEGE